MILADIDIKWDFDYEMHPDEQEWHEQFVATFKFKFDRWLQSCGVNSNYQVHFNLTYFPAVRKFKVQDISLNKNLFIHRIEEDRKFFKAYFIKDSN